MRTVFFNVKPGLLSIYKHVLPAVMCISCVSSASGQRISIEGTHFTVEGNEIFMNGVNTPWDHWNDFGGNYDHNFWDQEFQRIRQNGGNASRIWITCNGEVGIDISDEGIVTGVSDAHWEDLDDMFSLAMEHHIYIMATLISFDHTKNSHTGFMAWRNLLADNENTGTYIDQYVIPFINRYKDNPYLWCIDACNEIEWMHENDNNGLISWDRLQYFVARVAEAVHQISPVLVTLGSAAVKWNSDCSGCEGNMWSDENLQAQYNSQLSFLDFYSPHFYGWVVRWYGNFAVDKTPLSYGLTDRPVMIGENPATGVYEQNASGSDDLKVPISEAFVKTYENDWRGLLVWTSNGVDQNGSLDDCGEGLFNFAKTYPALVNPLIAGLNTKDMGIPDISIYPNPTAGMLQIDFGDYQFTIYVELFDTTGRRYSELRLDGAGVYRLDMRNFRPGLYLLQLSSGIQFSRAKIIKE